MLGVHFFSNHKLVNAKYYLYIFKKTAIATTGMILEGLLNIKTVICMELSIHARNPVERFSTLTLVPITNH